MSHTRFQTSSDKESGSASVEMVYVLLILLAFLAVVQNFSFAGTAAHRLSIELQRDLEDSMISHGRPPCLEKMTPNFIGLKTEEEFFGGRKIGKRLYFTKGPICQEVWE